MPLINNSSLVLFMTGALTALGEKTIRTMFNLLDEETVIFKVSYYNRKHTLLYEIPYRKGTLSMQFHFDLDNEISPNIYKVFSTSSLLLKVETTKSIVEISNDLITFDSARISIINVFRSIKNFIDHELLKNEPSV